MTHKTKIRKVNNGISYKLNGWIYVSIRGDPKERGYAYGYLVADEMIKIIDTINFNIYTNFGIKWSFFVDAAKKYFKPVIKRNFPEFYEEMEGFTRGCIDGGTETCIDEIIAWNNYFTLTGYWYNNMPAEERLKVYGNTNIQEKNNSNDGCISNDK